MRGRCGGFTKSPASVARGTFPFLESAFQKLLMNFTWWVNRKDTSGRNLFSGGFLGLDNVGVFDRSQALGDGNFLEQADGTAWMASYCLIMLSMALELARNDAVYEDIASKFFEHFVTITGRSMAPAGRSRAGFGIPATDFITTASPSAKVTMCR